MNGPIFTGKSLFSLEFRVIGNWEVSSCHNNVIKYFWISLSGLFPAQIKIIFSRIKFNVFHGGFMEHHLSVIFVAPDLGNLGPSSPQIPALNFTAELESSLHKFVNIVWKGC